VGAGAGSWTGRLRFHRDGDGMPGSFILRPELSGAAAPTSPYWSVRLWFWSALYDFSSSLECGKSDRAQVTP
jgi:hypothetical protein